LTIVFAVQIVRILLSNSENVSGLIPAMGQNVIINLLTPVLLAIGLFIG
jgi:1,4-dihydroxy-2-naphthoate octaprenyltransferase